MVESIVPGNSLNVNVKYAFTVDADQVYGNTSYSHIAIIVLDTDRNDTRFYFPIDNNSVILTAVNPYGLIVVPYNNPVTDRVNFKAVAGGKTYRLDGSDIPIAFLLQGTSQTLVAESGGGGSPA